MIATYLKSPKIRLKVHIFLPYHPFFIFFRMKRMQKILALCNWEATMTFRMASSKGSREIHAMNL